MSILDTIANVVVLSYLLPLGLFVLLYGTRSPWQASELGVALMFQKIGFTLVILLVVVAVFFEDYPGREWLRLVIYTVVGCFLWLDVFNVLSYQRRYPLDRTRYRHRSFRELVLQRFKR